MSGVLGKCSTTRWLRLSGLNPSDADDHGADQFLSLLCPNDREAALARSLEAPSPVSGAVPAKLGLGCGSLFITLMLCVCSLAAYGSTLPPQKTAQLSPTTSSGINQIVTAASTPTSSQVQ